jgi:subtilase family serine protease
MRRGIVVGLITFSSILATGGSAAMAAPGAAGEYAPVCSHALPVGVAGCHAIQLLSPAANWHGLHLAGVGPDRGAGKKPGGGGEGAPSGYYPTDLQSAYGLSAPGGPSAVDGAGQTVAIVDAYDDPNAQADLNHYREYFKLPSCEGGCFSKVNQQGEAGSYPNANTSWSQEISLDLDMVSAICPNCKILLVEAKSATFANLGAAAEYAAGHAKAVSNSYGGSEFSSELEYDPYYHHAGVAVTASAGDSGYGAEYPAASPFVTAVGGTTLVRATTARGFKETVWSGTGSGCSAYEPNLGWQPVTSLCGNRTVADAAADANPNTGVAVYDSYGQSGWLVFGGTSVSSPIVASVYALAGNAETLTGAGRLYLEASQPALYKIAEGANARRCSVYLCNAADSLLSEFGYNGPTGEGAPDGIAGF